MNDPVIRLPTAWLNPYHIDPEADFLAIPQRDLPLWSETMFFSVWDPASEVGIYIHTGRCPDDVELWWAKVCAYLPNGTVIVDRSFGRSTDRLGPATGNLRIRCEEPLQRWSLRFDGAGEQTTSDRMGFAPSGAGPAVPMKFDFTVDAVSPVWDLHGALSLTERSWAKAHHEQMHLASGSLSVGDRQWQLSQAISFRDHSNGKRDLTPLGGDCLLGVYLPHSGRTIQGLVMWNRSDIVELQTGWIYENGEFGTLQEVEITKLGDATGNPRNVTFSFVQCGKRHSVAIEVLHSVTMSMFEPNTNGNGTDLSLGDPLILTECPVRLTWHDGEIGYGNLERNQRHSRLQKLNSAQ